MNAELNLRDIHLPPEPSWWPPAVGWWVLAILGLIAVVVCTRWALRRRRAERRLAAMLSEFDSTTAHGNTAQRLATVSELLRRAARLRDPQASLLQGAAWLHFLDGIDAIGTTSAGDDLGHFCRTDLGDLLLSGPFRPETDSTQVDAVIRLARRRYKALVSTP